MPLLHKQKFIKKPIPTELDPNQEIFYCKLTQEIFLDYDEYFERTILCNSLVWTCSLSGKSGLTYSEALQSEEKAQQSITTFPRIIEKVVVFLATFTKRGNIKDLLDDVFTYIKDRYFISEMVTVVVGQANSKGEIRKICKIIDVIPPEDENESSEEEDNEDDDDDDDDQENKSEINPNKYRYIIETHNASGQSNRLTVRATQIGRQKGLLTKDKVQIILKMVCEAVNNIWVVKESAREKYSLNTIKFENVFKGPPPKFDISYGRGQFSKLNKLNTSKSNVQNVQKLNKQPISQSPNLKNNKNQFNNKQNIMKKSLSTSSIQNNNNNNNKLNTSQSQQRKSLNTSTSAKLSSKIKRKYSKQKPTTNDDNKRKSTSKVNNENDEELCKLFEKEIRMLEADRLMENKIVSMTDEEFELWHEFVCEEELEELFEIDIEFEKIKRKEEREKERERLREEKRLEKEHLKELKKPKEDLDFDNLMELPKAIPIKTKISQNLFGDALMIVEFLSCFGDLFDLNIDFPDGFHLELLEDALFSKSCDSALCNLLLFYLDWIFKCYDEENFDDININSDNDSSDIENETEEDDISIEKLYKAPISETNRENLINLAENFSKLIRNAQGRKLKAIGLDVYTISEMLRLYFLTSGSLHDHKIKFWYQQRGGYTNLDDVGIEFTLYENNIVKKLETTNVFELEPEEKLKILLNLNHQLITHVRFRDVLEENFQNLTTYKAQLRDLQTEENRRLKEEASDRWKKKLEDKAKQKTRLEEIKTNVVSNSLNLKETENLDNDDFKSKQQLDESNKKREEFLKKEKNILNDINEAQLKYSLAPLGRDRYYRRYWVYKSIPGVFIEDDDQYVEQLIDSMHVKQETNETSANDNINSSILSSNDNNNKNFNTSATTLTNGKENNPLLTNNLNNSILNCSNIISSSYFNTSEIKYNFKKGEIKWSFYYKQDDIEKLINCLNERGFRESELKQNLIDYKHKIIEKLNKCPYEHFTMNDEELEKHFKKLENLNNIKRRDYYLKIINEKSNDAIQANGLAYDYLEIDFRDKILDMEEQIHNGSLGSLKVCDRLKWKNAIEKGNYDPQCTSLTIADTTINVNSSKQDQTIVEIVNDLAKALIQVEQSVERRFLRIPLGDMSKTPDKNKNKGKKIKNDDEDDTQTQNEQWQTLWNWEKSLMKCTSLSQLFVHIQSLDESIAWSKSSLNTRCKICRKKGDAEKMLLCDKCDRGHHTYCLRPILKTIPEGEWFCPECRPKDVEKTQLKKYRKEVIEQDLFEDENAVDNNDNTINSDEDITVDDSNDEYNENVKRKSLKRKLEKSDSDIVAPIKTRGRPAKQLKITTASITSNDSNHSNGSKSKNSRQNGYDGSECYTEDEINSYDEIPIKNTRRSKNGGAKSPVEFYFNSTSSRNTESTQRLKLTEKLLADLMKHVDAWPFLKPVTKREAPDYFEVISTPMDFATIKNNINHFKYTDYTNILDDIRLIFSNCRTYNEPSSDIYKVGQRLNNFFEKQIKQLNLN